MRLRGVAGTLREMGRRHTHAALLALLCLACPPELWGSLRLILLGTLERTSPEGSSRRPETSPTEPCEQCRTLAIELFRTEWARAEAKAELGRILALLEALPGLEVPSVIPCRVLGGGEAASRMVSGGVASGMRLRLDKGSCAGIAGGEAVVSGSALAGRIIQRDEKSAEMLCATSPQFRVRAVSVRPGSPAAETAGLTEGILFGDGVEGLSYRPDGAFPDLREGDGLLVALGSRFAPAGLVLGTVTAISLDLRTGATEAAVRPAAPPDRLERVAVIAAPPEGGALP